MYYELNKWTVKKIQDRKEKSKFYDYESKNDERDDNTN